jgi:stage V sporulation protein B
MKKNKVFLTKKMESTSSILKTIIRLAVPVTIGASVITAANLVDLFMIKWRLLSSGFSEVRASQLYGILTGKVITILNLPTVITAAMVAVIVPSISVQAIKKNYNAMNEKIKSIVRLTMLIIMPAAVGLSVLSDPIVKMLFPTQPEGGYILAIGSYYLIFLALSQNITAVIQALGKPEIPAINLCIGMLIKVILNYFLIGIASVNILGTQISSIICYFITFMLNYYALKRMTNFKFPLVKGVIIPSLASCVMFVSVVISYMKFSLFFNLTISTIISILIGIITYIFSIILVGGIEQRDIELVFGKKK